MDEKESCLKCSVLHQCVGGSLSVSLDGKVPCQVKNMVPLRSKGKMRTLNS